MVDFDPSIIAREFEVTKPVEVTREMIDTFCAALGESNPLYTDEETAKRGPYGGLVAPPSFAVTFRTRRHFMGHVPGLNRLGFDAGKDMEFLAPIRPGDRVTVGSAVKEIYEKTGRSGAMVFVVVRSTLRNQNGEILAYIDHRFMSRR